MRARFFRRLAVVAVVMLAFSIIGIVTIARMLATRWGLLGPGGSTATTALALGAAGAVALAAIGVAAAMRRVARPLGGIMNAADRVADGDYDVRVAEHGPPPIRALAHSFNTMAARLQDHDRLRRNLMADTAHELRTPLTVMQGKLEGLVDGVYPRDDVQLEQLLDQTHVLSRLVEDLRTLALSESGALALQREPTDIVALARDAALTFGRDGAARGVTVAADGPSDLAPITIDPMRIRQVLGDLVTNALRHTEAGGRVTIVVRSSPDGIAIEVRDTGAGMTDEQIAHAFDRFYKGSASGGSGLGLTIARNLVVAHGGEIRASSAAGHGTTITVTLPDRPD